ncbi:hypothetical protein J2Z48_002817 [Croceifilum oryzae]|uniref:Uncharacterized protein n=1 Tax=Croceifilum oryzae TaxID=1553429 RepID=A0AAJ1THK3_9BACL|nr:hypothetical protein [Croceifilum oryzae]
MIVKSGFELGMVKASNNGVIGEKKIIRSDGLDILME